MALFLTATFPREMASRDSPGQIATLEHEIFLCSALWAVMMAHCPLVHVLTNQQLFTVKTCNNAVCKDWIWQINK